MATHNKDRIPWETLREYTRLRKANTTSSQPADVLHTLIRAIKDTLRQDILEEVTKYQQSKSTVTDIKDTDIIISDHAALRITPMVNQWRTNIFFAKGLGGILEKGDKKYRKWKDRLFCALPGFYATDYTARYRFESIEARAAAIRKRLDRDVSTQLCTHDNGFRCRCTLPRCERTVAAQSRHADLFQCGDFMDACTKEYFGALVLQSLILSGDMEPLYRMRNRQSNVFSWYKKEECCCEVRLQRGGCAFACPFFIFNFFGSPSEQKFNILQYITPTMGWAFLQETCLWSYVALNALLVLSNTRFKNPLINNKNYQGLAVYQMLLERTKKHDYPNRVNQDVYSSNPDKPSFWEQIPLPFSAEEKQAATNVLLVKGLPNELVQHVLRHVVQPERIRIEGDPLHLANRSAIKQYMEMCWRVVVRCGVLTQGKMPKEYYAVDVEAIFTELDAKLVEDGLLPSLLSGS